MHLVKRCCALLTTASLTTAVLVAAPFTATARDAAAPAAADTSRTTRAQVVLNWERIAFRTVYTDAAAPVPVGVPVLGYTSLAIHRAVQASPSRDRASSERAAVIASAY